MFKINKIDDRVIIETYFYGINGLYFKFMGKLNDKDIDLDRIHSILDKVFSRDVIYKVDDIEKVIRYIRTVCCDFKEEELFVNIRDKGCERIVSFDRGDLVKSISYDLISKDMNVEFVYDINSSQNFVIKTGNSQLGSCYGKELIEFVREEIKLLDELRNIHRITLTNNHKKLCKFYQMFYRENPNFNDSSTKMKTQIMMALLEEYKVGIGDNYYCRKVPDSFRFVMIVRFENLLKELEPFGVIDESFSDIEFSPHINKVISIISDEVHKCLNNNMNDLKALMSILNFKVNGYSEGDEDSFIRSSPELMSKIKVLRKIDDRIKGEDK